jgi:hypothetical protein
MLPTHLKTRLFAVLRTLQLGIVALGIVWALVVQHDQSVASQGSRTTSPRCSIPTMLTLWDDQRLARGQVAVWNDATQLYVQFFALEPWTLTATHVHVTTPLDRVLVTNQRAFMRGHVDETRDHAQVPAYAYTIPLTWTDVTALVITARGSVAGSDSPGDSAPPAAIWGSTHLGASARQPYFTYTLHRCADEKDYAVGVPVASVDARPGPWAAAVSLCPPFWHKTPCPMRERAIQKPSSRTLGPADTSLGKEVGWSLTRQVPGGISALRPHDDPGDQ